jgi:hypothetical protein
MSNIPLSEQLACARRELSFRQRVYPRLVENGKMTQAEADKELARMQALHDTVMRLQKQESPSLL